MAQALNSHKPITEMQQLNRQGVARWMGSTKTLRLFGVGDKTHTDVMKRPAASESKRPAASRDATARSQQSPTTQDVTLGLGNMPYRMRDLTDVDPRLGSFLRACASQTAGWDNCLQQPSYDKAMEHISAMVAVVAQNCDGSLKKDLSMSYVQKSITRKIAIALLACGGAQTDWEKMTLKYLIKTCPDQHSFLEQFPESMSAADLSRFLYGRPDWAVFASASACLWHEVGTTYDRELVLVVVVDGRVERKASALRYCCGHTCAPVKIVEALGLA